MKVLFIMGSGGHTAQMLNLLSKLDKKFDYEYLVNENDLMTQRKIKGKIHKLPNPRQFRDNILSEIYKTITSFMRSILLVRRFDVIISAGPGITVPVFYAAKLLGKKTIFIESWSRVTSKSLSGKLCYPVADLFFVQWLELKKKYPKAIYGGRLG
jgi:UDP-N-acetylglucosamine:LPS N-acetylglucosamine transferase